MEWVWSGRDSALLLGCRRGYSPADGLLPAATGPQAIRRWDARVSALVERSLFTPPLLSLYCLGLPWRYLAQRPRMLGPLSLSAAKMCVFVGGLYRLRCIRNE